MPWLAVDLYITYFTDLIPRMSGRTIVNVVNQSLTGFLMRFVVPLKEALSWGPPLVIDAWVRWVNISLLAAWCAGAGFVMSSRKNDGKVVAASYLLAAIPMFSPLGWGHAYVFALPGILLVFHKYASNDRKDVFPKAVVLVALLALMIPAYHKFLFFGSLPSALQNMVYSRYFLATLSCCVLQLYSLKILSSNKGLGLREKERDVAAL